MTELEFILAVKNRQPGECLGPGLALVISQQRIAVLAGIPSLVLSNLLEASAGDLDEPEVTFWLCAAHWVDIACMAGINGKLYARRDWLTEASALVRQTCQTADWDTKEIANLLQWQRMVS